MNISVWIKYWTILYQFQEIEIKEYLCRCGCGKSIAIQKYKTLLLFWDMIGIFYDTFVKKIVERVSTNICINPRKIFLNFKFLQKWYYSSVFFYWNESRYLNPTQTSQWSSHWFNDSINHLNIISRKFVLNLKISWNSIKYIQQNTSYSKNLPRYSLNKKSYQCFF